MKERLYKYYTKVVLWLSKSYTIYILITAVVFLFLLIAVFLKKLQLVDVIEFSALSAVLLEGTLISLSKILCKHLLNKVEDPSKLNHNYDQIVSTYGSSKNSMIIGSDSHCIPVVFESWLYDKKIIIYDDPLDRYVLPEIASRYYEKLFSAHITSNIYNNINIRVLDWKADDDRFIINTGRTTYYESMVTNRAMDYEVEKGISIRQLYECGPVIMPLKLSKLSNHLGFNGFVESSDNKFAFVMRQDNVSIGKRTYGNSIGASLKSKYALKDYEFELSGLEEGIIAEIKDELKIKSEQIVDVVGGKNLLNKIIIIAAYRDLVEGGKPQLLIYCKSNQKEKEITNNFKSAQKETKDRTKNASQRREKQEIEMETDGNKLIWISKEDIISGNVKVYSDRMEHNSKKYPMMPSASACLVMLRDYLRANDNTKCK